MGTGTFAVVGASKPSQHSMKISILTKSVECCDAFRCGRDGFVAGETVFIVGDAVFAMDGAVSLQNRQPAVC